ncbi:hypothetical protein ACE6H2_023920 [Prunus campanulata]
MLINNNPQNSANCARQSPNADNVASCSDAYLSDNVVEGAQLVLLSSTKDILFSNV